MTAAFCLFSIRFAWAQEAGGAAPLSLTEAVRLALEIHPSVRVAEASESAATAAVGQVKASTVPQVRGQASVTRYQEPWIVAPLHGLDFSNPPQFDKTLLRGDITLAYALFDGGARRSEVDGARAQAAGASAARTASEASLIMEVVRAYLNVLTARGVLDAEDRRIEALQAEKHRVELFLNEGRAARVEVLRVDASLAEAEAERVATSARLQVAERELARLADLPEERTRAVNLRLVEIAVPLGSEEESVWLERARAANPDLQAARRGLEAAEAGRRAAHASWYPEIDVMAGYLGYGSASGHGDAEWQAGLNLSYPVFTGGGRTSTIENAIARERRAREEVRLVELRIESGTDRALTAARETGAVVAAVAKGVEHQTEVVRIERLSLDAGAGTQTDYLRAEADLARARSFLVEARHAEIAARVELARVAGELQVGWLERNLETEP